MTQSFPVAFTGQADGPPTAPAKRDPELSAGQLDFEQVYENWFQDVSRWVRAMGGLHPDTEDIVQDVFLIVKRKLAQFDGDNLPGFLYRIAQRTTRDYRRKAWVRRWLPMDRPKLEAVADPGADPNTLMERSEARNWVARTVSKLSDAQRVAFVLYEIEGYSCIEIARLEQVPVNTVYARLSQARKEFLKQVARQSGKEVHRVSPST